MVLTLNPVLVSHALKASSASAYGKPEAKPSSKIATIFRLLNTAKYEEIDFMMHSLI
jgi:hypothetical protein